MALSLAVAGGLHMGEIDLAIGSALDLPSRIKKQFLFSEPYACVMRRGHPLAGPRLSHEDYMAAEHLALSHMGEPLQAVDIHLRKDGAKRRDSNHDEPDYASSGGLTTFRPDPSNSV